MNEVHNSIPTAGYNDRRAGLIVFGILEILLGALCAAILAALFLARLLIPSAVSQLDQRTMTTAASVYVVMAVILIWLGIGSTLCRRWARTLLLILAWSWLLLGVMTLGFLIWFARAFPIGGASGIFLGITITIISIFCIVLPGAMVLFYQSRHVRATCEARDPLPRWTDSCPLPVLTNSVWLGLGAVWLLTTPLTKQNVMPLFGYLVTGTVATLFYLIYAAFGFYLAQATYRLKMAGWWGMLAAFTLFTASVSITFARVDLLEFYRKSGYSEEQIAQIANMPFFTGRMIAWANAAFFVLFLIYLLWIKKYFQKTADTRG